MSKMKRILAIFISVVMLSCCFQNLLPVRAAEPVDIIEGTGTISSSNGNSDASVDTFEHVFTENWEDGLDTNKWNIARRDASYVADFRVVDDPLDTSEGEKNQVIKAGRNNTLLIPSDDYWPTTEYMAGEISSFSFRLYLENFDVGATGTHVGPAKTEVAAALRVQADSSGIVRNNDIVGFYSSITVNGKTKAGLLPIWDSRNSDTGTQAIGTTKLAGVESSGLFVEGFDTKNWITVSGKFNGTSVMLNLTDVNGKVISTKHSCVNKQGRFAVGRYTTSDGNKESTNGIIYMDDININFVKSDFDTDNEPVDVDVYYAGNTFLAPGNTVNLIGNELGTTVLNAQLAKMDNTLTYDASGALDVSAAQYIKETGYDIYYEDSYTEGNVVKSYAEETWSSLALLNDSLIAPYSIEQRSDMGLKMILPDGTGESKSMYREPGMYALYLTAATENAANELVVLNNPVVKLLSHDDGDYATPNGWVKLGGDNLSVQDDISKVNAIIIDSTGKRTLIPNANIEADTTDNNPSRNPEDEAGVDCHYYLKINFDGLNLAAGHYQIMVHNGYGGDYGWSTPYDFVVGMQLENGTWETRAANEVWKSKGTFNVQDYGAVGDTTTNDTAAIQRAINAAVKNGGGVVYFPRSADTQKTGYRITHPLRVAENITFMGDGIGTTSLIYYGNFDIDHQECMISYEKNFEICNMEVACETNVFESAIRRASEVNDDAGKLYIHDVKFLIAPFMIASAGYGVTYPELSDGEVQTKIKEFWTGKSQYIFDCKTTETLIQSYNCDWDGHDMNGTPGVVGKVYAYYLDFEEVAFTSGWATTAGFINNCTSGHIVCNSVIRNVVEKDTDVNNREKMLWDGGALVYDSTVQTISYEQLEQSIEKENISAVKTYMEKHGRVVYRFTSKQTKASDGNSIYITSGQGAGQMRKLQNVTHIGSCTYFTVDTPWAVSPNRNSLVDVTGIKQNVYLNNAYFYDGSLVGPYGAASNIVFDHVTMRCGEPGVTFAVAYHGFMWYCTARNIDSDDIGEYHVTQFGRYTAGTRVGELAGGLTFLGIRYCDSYMGDKGILAINSGGSKQKVTASEYVYENIEIVSKKPAVEIDLSKKLQGVWLRNVRQYTDGNNKQYSELSPYTNYTGVQSFADTNGLKYFWADNVQSQWERTKGDIDADSFVSMPDLGLLREYMAGVYQFDEKQLSYADMNDDDIIDAYDFLYLRAYVLFGHDEEQLKVEIDKIKMFMPEYAKYGSDKLKVVKDISEMVYTNHISLGGTGDYKFNEAEGYASSKTTALKVNGGETIRIKSDCEIEGLQIYVKQFSSTKMDRNSRVHSLGAVKFATAITLKPEAKYILIDFKRADGASFTDEQVASLSNVLEIYEKNATYGSDNLKVVDDISEMVYTNHISLGGTGDYKFNEAEGYASSKTTALEVNGSETIQIKSDCEIEGLQIYVKQFSSTTMNNSSRVHSLGAVKFATDITLKPEAKYILIGFKRADGASFTDEEVASLSNVLEIVTETIDQTTYWKDCDEDATKETLKYEGPALESNQHVKQIKLTFGASVLNNKNSRIRLMYHCDADGKWSTVEYRVTGDGYLYAALVQVGSDGTAAKNTSGDISASKTVGTSALTHESSANKTKTSTSLNAATGHSVVITYETDNTVRFQFYNSAETTDNTTLIYDSVLTSKTKSFWSNNVVFQLQSLIGANVDVSNIDLINE